MDYQLYFCRRCGHEVLSPDRPYPIRWMDGHVCQFTLKHEKETSDVLGTNRGSSGTDTDPDDRLPGVQENEN